MLKFTVLGFYAEDNQTTADPAEAEDGMEAMGIVARERLGERDAAGDYENQGNWNLICAVQEGMPITKPGACITFPGEGMVEAREFIEPGWDLEEDPNEAAGRAFRNKILGSEGDEEA